MADLKPCPFCGRTPTVDDCGDHRYFVRCKCGIAQDKLYAQKCDAVRRWNTRKTTLADVQPTQTNAESTQDLISRQDAIRIVDGIDTWQAGWRGNTIESMKALPSAQPQREKGNWVCSDGINYECDQCGCVLEDWIQRGGFFNYCPNCGADMSGGEQDG